MRHWKNEVTGSTVVLLAEVMKYYTVHE